MPSTAISAQGSTVEISGTGGAAKTISGVQLSNPCIVTATAHGLTKGDVVAIAGIVGTTQLNGNSYVVTHTTTNTITLNVDASGFTAYTSGGTATPNAWTLISNVRSFSNLDGGSSSEIDVTNLSSTAKEYRLGLVDSGTLTMELDQDNADAGYLALRTNKNSGTQKNFRIKLPNTNTATFAAFVKKLDAAGSVDGVMKSSAELRITGAVTWA